VATLTLLAQSLGLAFTSGVSVYATIAFLGIASRMGWIGTLPGALSVLSDGWVLAAACALLALEILASLVPLVATTWEAVHTGIRPFAAGGIAALTAWGSSPRVVAVAALLGLGLGLATHATKLGVRAAVDTSPEPFSNGAATAAELSVVGALGWAVWNHPWIALGTALALLVGLTLAMRALWRGIRRTFAGPFGGGGAG
jgi:hypothetical protein